jgi:uroporphyrinogen-III synthase
VDVVEAYRTIIPESSIAKVRDAFSSCPPDAVTFTSSSTVTNFFALLRAGDVERPTGLMAFSIGPVTSRTLREYGWEPAAEADPHNVEGLVESLIRTIGFGR